MTGDVTVGYLKKLSYHPDDNPMADLIAGQNYWDVQFTGGLAENLTLRNCTIEGGGAGSDDAISIQGTPVDATPPTINQVLIFNGIKFKAADQGTIFSLSITSFSDSLSSPIEIGAGTWKAIGAISFTASYFGTPTSANVSMAGGGNSWSPNSLAMTNSYQGATATAQRVDYPSVDSTVTFSLAASGSTGSASSSISHTFNNRLYWGVSTKASGYSASDVTVLVSNSLRGSKSGTFSATPSSTQYIIFAYPKRYGTAVFTVNGFSGGFQSPETVSITNASGYTEDYYVYRSTNVNLGATNFTVS